MHCLPLKRLKAISMKQQTLPLALPASVSFQDYIIGSSNQAAYDALMGEAPWASHAMLLHGEQGCGKTMLGHVWAQEAGAMLLPSALPEECLAEISNQSYVLDDYEQAAPDALFHLLNQCKAHDATLLLTSQYGQSAIPFALPDLCSRLRALPTLTIAPPDDEMLSALLMQLFVERQLKTDASIIRYIIPRMQRSFAAAYALVEALDALSLSEKRAITLPLVRQVLEK